MVLVYILLLNILLVNLLLMWNGLLRVFLIVLTGLMGALK